jgi:3-hydroxybutyryl-CoA dehydratase
MEIGGQHNRSIAAVVNSVQHLGAASRIGAAPISRELTDSMVAILGNDARYKRPAFVGDTVTPQFTLLAVEAKDDSRGVLRLAIALHNQRDELVLEGTHILMLRRRMESN